MPQRRLPHAEWIALAVLCLALPPALRATLVAATAGTLFEATPFVLAAVLVPRGRFASLFAVLGCGCGRIGPGALSLPALGLCWLAFGPTVALGRAAAALGLRRLARGRRRDSASADPLAGLERIAPAAVAAGLLAEALRWLASTAIPPPALLIGSVAAGLLLGLLAPCSTGAIAIAAAVRDVSPATSAAILCTAGIVTFPGLPAGRPAANGMAHPRLARDARAPFVLLSFTCAWLALHGPSGFVNPRFIVPLGVAASAAAWSVFGAPASRARAAGLVPALLLGALLVGSPVPTRAPLTTTLDDPYPGEAVRFTGALQAPSSQTHAGATLVRYLITCCRADAQARAVRLDRPLAGSVGGWYDASGTLALEGRGYVLRVASLRRIAPPADPFAYR